MKKLNIAKISKRKNLMNLKSATFVMKSVVKKCMITARFIGAVNIWACPTCLEYSINPNKNTRKHVRKLTEEEVIFLHIRNE